mgnify:FL=1|tara:strand:- start:2947 stop:3462 length:516 start_codon:yes stop_codon:yes gene_type:complete
MEPNRLRLAERSLLLEQLGVDPDSSEADTLLAVTETNLRVMEESGMDANLLAWGLRVMIDYSGDMLDWMLDVESREDVMVCMEMWLEAKQAELSEEVGRMVDRWANISPFRLYTMFSDFTEQANAGGMGPALSDMSEDLIYRVWSREVNAWMDKTKIEIENTFYEEHDATR